MLMPSIFGETLLDDFFGFPTLEGRKATSNTNGLMQTDIKEKANEYCVTMNLPGFKKEDIKGEIKDGYLVITASTNTENEDKDEDGKYIRRERYSGTCSRSFYVGEDVTQEDIKGEYKHGILKLFVPKKEAKPAVEQKHSISIEG